MKENEKILYVSDLDGTLLNEKQKLSDYTVKTINNLIGKGLYFSYATARSLTSASIVTKGLTTTIPVIIYNGTFIVNSQTKEKLFSIYFNQEEKNIIKKYLDTNTIYPLIYGYVNGEEKVSWIKPESV